MSIRVDITERSVELRVEGVEVHDIQMKDVIVDYDLLGDPVAIEAFDFKKCPFLSDEIIGPDGIRLSFDSSTQAVWILLRKGRSSDQEELEAEFGFDRAQILAHVKFSYEKGRAAAVHKQMKGA